MRIIYEKYSKKGCSMCPKRISRARLKMWPKITTCSKHCRIWETIRKQKERRSKSKIKIYNKKYYDKQKLNQENLESERTL